MAINIVFCANAADRQVAVATMQAAGNNPVTFASNDAMAATATVSGDRLVQGAVTSTAFVVIGVAAPKGA